MLESPFIAEQVLKGELRKERHWLRFGKEVGAKMGVYERQMNFSDD